MLEITESAEFLENSLKQAKSGTRKERLLVLWWVKTGQIRYRFELSSRLSRRSAVGCAVEKELSQLTPAQVQSLTSFDFSLEAMMLAAF